MGDRRSRRQKGREKVGERTTPVVVGCLLSVSATS